MKKTVLNTVLSTAFIVALGAGVSACGGGEEHEEVLAKDRVDEAAEVARAKAPEAEKMEFPEAPAPMPAADGDVAAAEGTATTDAAMTETGTADTATATDSTDAAMTSTDAGAATDSTDTAATTETATTDAAPQ